ncbi:MAG TPA: DUF1992 domain-containing protein [Acidimicrobiales bacterium]
MTERKPAGVSFETWVDAQIREAQARGEFDDLPGKGKPLRGIDEPYDELWWVKQLLAREELTYTPPGLALRKAVDDTFERLATFTSEAAVRAVVEELNERIRRTNRIPTDGPPSNLMPMDADRVVATWRERRAAAAGAG